MIHEVMGPVIDIHGGGRCARPGALGLPGSAWSRLDVVMSSCVGPSALCFYCWHASSSQPRAAVCHVYAYARRDLVFPHHENELAQSRAAAGACSCGHDHGASGSGSGSSGSSDGSSGSEEFVRFWLHNGACCCDSQLVRWPAAAHVRAHYPPFLCIALAGFVNVDSEKMSKSLGNFFTIRWGGVEFCLPALFPLSCTQWPALHRIRCTTMHSQLLSVMLAGRRGGGGAGR